MVDLIHRRRNEHVYECPKPVAQLWHETQVYGPPGKGTLRRLKDRNSDHWYLFDQSGRAVARISPEELAIALRV